MTIKIVRYLDQTRGAARFGFLDGTTVLSGTGAPLSGLAPGEPAGDVGSLQLLAPVEPSKIVCVGLNYAAHVTERDATRAIPEEPVLFMKPTSAIVGPGAAIEIAYLDHETHHEAGLVVVIGRRADHVSATDALDFVLGYTCGNDVSDRALQKKDGQWIRAKGFRTYCPLGPHIETDLDIASIPVISRVNGAVRQSQSTAAMLWHVPALISYISGILTLDPGDVIMTGTPDGVGPLQPGDEVEIEIGGIGILPNSVTASQIVPPPAPAARNL